MSILGLAQGFAALGVNYLPADPNTTLAKWLFVGAAVFVVTGLAVFFWPQRTEAVTQSAEQAGSGNVQFQGQTINFQGTISTGEESISVGELPDGRTIVDVTPEYLTGLFDDHTDIQAERLIEAFIGKWMRVSGPVGNVSSITEGKAVVRFPNSSSGDPYGFLNVTMYFNDESVIDNRLRILQKGDRIQVVGQIRRVSSAWVELEDCELETL